MGLQPYSLEKSRHKLHRSLPDGLPRRLLHKLLCNHGVSCAGNAASCVHALLASALAQGAAPLPCRLARVLAAAVLGAASCSGRPFFKRSSPGGGVRGLPAAKMAVGKNKRMSKGKKGGKKKM